jgi:hypothetical protein
MPARRGADPASPENEHGGDADQGKSQQKEQVEGQSPVMRQYPDELDDQEIKKIGHGIAVKISAQRSAEHPVLQIPSVLDYPLYDRRIK